MGARPKPPEWLRPGLNEVVIDGRRETVCLDTRLYKLLNAFLDKFADGERSRRERRKAADSVRRLEDSGAVLFVDDKHRELNKKRAASKRKVAGNG